MRHIALYLAVGVLIALCVLLLGFAMSQADTPLQWIGVRVG